MQFHKTEMLIWANLNKSRSLAGQGKYSEAFENIDAAIKINGSETKLTFVKEKINIFLILRKIISNHYS